MKRSTTSTRSRVLSYARQQPEGALIRGNELLSFGSRAAVDQALSRLAREGALLRVARGVYARPVEGAFGARAPSENAIIKAWAAARGEVVAPAPVTAANALGLTTQNPVRAVFVTSGRSRTLNLGGRTIELRHAPGWLVNAPASKAGTIVRAGAWLGPGRAATALAPSVSELDATERTELQRAVAGAPTWLASAVLRPVATGRRPAHA